MAKLLLFQISDGLSFFQKSGKNFSTNGGFSFQSQPLRDFSARLLRKKNKDSKAVKPLNPYFLGYMYCSYCLFCTLVRYSLGDIPSAALKHFEKYFGSEKPHP